ncbi:MAG: hypothetical protein GY791_04135 [Alphaproteobacteria bacterium]|nr:hypothetical protein [Alphaproteobacteria bacterium]
MKIARLWRKWPVAAGILTLAVATASAGAAEIPIPPRMVETQVDTARIPVAVAGRIDATGTGAAVEARVFLDADLRPVQQRVQDLLRARLDRDNPCGDRVRVEAASLTPAPPAARLSTTLTYARALCIGQNKKKIRTRLFDETGTIVVDIVPGTRDGRIVVTVKVVSVTAKSPLRQILSNPGLLQPVADRIAGDAIREIEGLVPAPIRDFAPRYTAAVFYAREGTGLGIAIEALRRTSEAELARLAALLNGAQ